MQDANLCDLGDGLLSTYCLSRHISIPVYSDGQANSLYPEPPGPGHLKLEDVKVDRLAKFGSRALPDRFLS